MFRIRKRVVYYAWIYDAAMVLLSVVQVWVLATVDTFLRTAVSKQIAGISTRRPAWCFLLLNEPHNPTYAGRPAGTAGDDRCGSRGRTGRGASDFQGSESNL